MRRLAKRALIAALFLVVALYGGGCGASGSDPAAPSPSPSPTRADQITLSVNGTALTVDLADTDAARELAALLDGGALTLEMHDYGGFEKTADLPRALTQSDAQITAEPGDVMLYQGNRLVIFYGTNSYAYTRLGRVAGATAETMRAALGEGAVSVTLSRRRPAADARVMLNSGRTMPTLGYGTWTISDTDVEELVYHAIKAGYRLIDTAKYYGNEAGVGRGARRAIADGLVTREELFVTTKIAPWGGTGYDEDIDERNARLDLDYIDLMLIHQSGAGELEMYRAMERAIERGVVRSLGISNYYTPEAVRAVTAGAKIMPAVIQNENHPFYQNAGLLEYAAQIGAVIESYYPLGGRGHTRDVLEAPTVARIAAAHGKTAAQVVLRWHLQAGFIAIPGSGNTAHITENFGAYGFELTDAEMADIAAMDTGRRYESW